MKMMIILFFFFIGSSLLASPETEPQKDFCGIHIQSPEPIKFTNVEKDWLCGKPGSGPWEVVPSSQKKIFLQSFLQSRGYLSPRFHEQNNELLVETGPLTEVQEMRVEEAPKEWDWTRRRRVRHRILNPALLDEMTKWSRQALQYRGYPCPVVDSKAIIEQKKIELTVTPGTKTLFSHYETQGEDQIDTRVLDRYTAFLPGDSFDGRLLEITSNRILQEDLYVSAYFDLICSQDQTVHIVRRLMPAQPRLLTFGIGFDSEEGPIVKSAWKATRLNDVADSFESAIYGSLRSQKFISRYHHYLSSTLSSRLQLIPSLTLERKVESNFETKTSQVGAAIGYGWEQSTFRPEFEVGPLLETTDLTQQGETVRVQSVQVNAEVRAMSHLYEYYMGEPQEGWLVSLNSSSRFQNIVSQQTFHRVILKHHLYWNIEAWDPPFLILGARGFAGTFISDHSSLDTVEVPVSERLFLGGNQDLRGFGRRALPGGQQGFLSVFYEGLELRAGQWFKYPIQPLILFDFAMGGLEEGRLDGSQYYSPGIGVRYASPFGPLRATLARGYVRSREIEDPNTGYQFYFSFGREF